MEQRPNNSKSRTNKTLFGLIVTLVGFLVVGGGLFHMKSSELNRLRAVGLGPNTCFFRINQTFTARMISDRNSKYLGKEFITDTENCFADLAGLVANSDSMLKQRANHLAALANQFHNSLDMAKSVFTRNSEDGVGPMSYYKKLEATKFEIENLLDKGAKKIESFLARLQWPLGLTLLSLVFACLRLFKNTEPSLPNFAESAAYQALQATIIHENRILAARDRGPSLLTDNPTTVAIAETTEVTPTERPPIEAMLTPLADLNLTETVLIEEIISKTLERLAPIIFSEGITIDLNLCEKATVAAEKEEIVDQIIYQVLTSAVKVVRPCHAVSVRLAQLDTGFSLEAIATVRPGKILTEENIARTGLDITKALALDASLDFTTLALRDQDGNMIGMKISLGTNLLFQQTQAQSVSAPQLVRVKKATKRELLQEFGAT
ncbi:MAG: hypothetical protein A2X86_07680 [Bdellovibrionales bacterium GWA2_49_15]|nr:MAG: hypothetical protein A2X86_07680 [Bdellovibrionales bacterium GWA2_49_15]HAZ11842.1 hypothetical protein [Bdellovibrionales bacterium]